jgi:hypothetical protein
MYWRSDCQSQRKAPAAFQPAPIRLIGLNVLAVVALPKTTAAGAMATARFAVYGRSPPYKRARRTHGYGSTAVLPGGCADRVRMDRQARREHLKGLLEELREQRKADVDQVLMELVHFVFELDDEMRRLNTQISKIERRG